MPGAWAGSTRATRLPPDWPAIRTRILARDGHRCTVLMRDGTRCRDKATQVDHIEAGDNHNEDNLRAICDWHHKRKSSAEGNQARARNGFSAKRPAERHPGIL